MTRLWSVVGLQGDTIRGRPLAVVPLGATSGRWRQPLVHALHPHMLDPATPA
jgi:hypothetical protein